MQELVGTEDRAELGGVRELPADRKLEDEQWIWSVDA